MPNGMKRKDGVDVVTCLVVVVRCTVLYPGYKSETSCDIIDTSVSFQFRVLLCNMNKVIVVVLLLLCVS